MEAILPYAYALLVFSIVAFLFVLLGRIFINVETTYLYRTERLIKKDDKNYGVDLTFMLIAMGKEGWSFVSVEDSMSFGVGAREVLVVFVKTKNKIRLFG